MIYVCKYSNILQMIRRQNLCSTSTSISLETMLALTRVFSIGTAKVLADDIMQDFGGSFYLIRLL